MYTLKQHLSTKTRHNSPIGAKIQTVWAFIDPITIEKWSKNTPSSHRKVEFPQNIIGGWDTNTPRPTCRLLIIQITIPQTT